MYASAVVRRAYHVVPMNTSPLNILVTDDQESVRDSFIQMLKHLGHSCDVAVDGDDCLKKITNTNYDVLFLDLVMPGLDGEHVLSFVKRRSPQTDIIIISAQDDDRIIQDLLTAGATAYIVKPVSLMAMSDLLRKIIEKRKGN